MLCSCVLSLSFVSYVAWEEDGNDELHVVGYMYPT